MGLSIERKVDRRIEALGRELLHPPCGSAAWVEHTERLISEYSQLHLQLSLSRQAGRLSTLPASDEDLLPRELERLDEMERGRIEAVIAPRDRGYFRRKLKRWGRENLREFPWRDTSDPYAILVAETFLQQTRAENVVPIYLRFMGRYPNFKALSESDGVALAVLLSPLGLKARAMRLKKLAGAVMENHGGKLPESEEKLLKLPGVGRYTARSVCANAYGQPLAVIDTNIARILERFFGWQGGNIKGRDGFLWDLAEAIAPRRKVGRWNLTLIDFGAAVCRAKSPKCGGCPLRKRCCFHLKTP